MTIQRQQFRMPVSRSGLVTKEHTTMLCEIVDITEQGLHFSTDLVLSTNETVRIECQLDADCIIQCEVVIRHAQPPHFGGHITHLLPEHQQQLALFIQRLIISSMAGL
jgi:hypothetical protein